MTTWLKRAITCVSIAVICTVLSACAAGPPPTTPVPPAQRYYLMVFNDALPGADAEFNRCFDADRIPDARTLPGFASVQRFQLNDPQMYPGVTVALPKYLTLYEISTNDLAATMDQFHRTAGVTGTGSCVGANPTTADVYVYRFSAPRQDRTAPDPTVPPGGPRTGYVHIVFTVPQQAMKSQFEQWYLTTHMPELLARPGFTTAQWVALAQAQGPVPPTDTAAVYRLELPRTRSISATAVLPSPGAAPSLTGQMLDPNLNRGYTYREFGPPLTAP